MFDFFLVLAVIDPATLLFGIITRTSMPLWLIALFIYLLIISITTEDILKKLKYVFISLPILFIVFIPYMTTKHYHIIFICMDVVLLFVFLKWLITSYVEHKKLNIFYLMLVFYIITIILKFFNLLIGFADASAFFVITSVAQIFFGLFFSVVREDGAGIVH
ncbi:MAG: hypothetical protein WCZ90_00615 [Melioribacteraceae bacterium]